MTSNELAAGLKNGSLVGWLAVEAAGESKWLSQYGIIRDSREQESLEHVPFKLGWVHH